jgi:hypothetical protein
MPKWTCSDCDWWETINATAKPTFYCPECGADVAPHCDPDSLSDAKTLTDKV